jgi:hypothetical protein
MGWMFNGWDASSKDTHLAFRYGQWKYVRNSKSCSNADCKVAQLFDLSADLGEKHDVSKDHPAVFAAIEANFSTWYQSVLRSIVNESQCVHIGPVTPTPPPAPPGPAPPSSACTWDMNTALNGGAECGRVNTTSKEECCGYCTSNKNCVGAAFHASGSAKLLGLCVMRKGPLVTKAEDGAITCVPPTDTQLGTGEGMEWAIDES